MSDKNDNVLRAWNEPGGGDKKDNPWGKRKDPDGPPDLDEIFKNFSQKLRSIFGKSGNRPGAPAGGSNKGGAQLFIFLILGIAALIYLLLGFYMIASYEQGVVTRFGKYSHTVKSGLHWVP